MSNHNTRNSTGWCVEAHDLAVSKLIAYRDKDRNFVRVLLTQRLIDPREVEERLCQLPEHPRVTPTILKAIREWMAGVTKDLRG